MLQLATHFGKYFPFFNNFRQLQSWFRKIHIIEHSIISFLLQCEMSNVKLNNVNGTTTDHVDDAWFAEEM